MRHGAPPDPLLRGALYFFGCVGGGLQTLLVPARWGCVFLHYPKYSVLDGDITNLPLYHHLLLWVLSFGVLSRRRTGMRQGGLK